MKRYTRVLSIYACFCLMGAMMLFSCQKSAPTEDSSKTATPASEVSPNKKPEIPQRFMYTYVAKCQMRCAKITPKIIREAVAKGKLKTKKHWLAKKPCPFYATSYTTEKGDNLVVIFAVCSTAGSPKPSTKIVRVFDKNMKNCDCSNKKIIPPANAPK